MSANLDLFSTPEPRGSVMRSKESFATCASITNKPHFMCSLVFVVILNKLFIFTSTINKHNTISSDHLSPNPVVVLRLPLLLGTVRQRALGELLMALPIQVPPIVDIFIVGLEREQWGVVRNIDARIATREVATVFVIGPMELVKF